MEVAVSNPESVEKILPGRNFTLSPVVVGIQLIAILIEQRQPKIK